MEGSGGGGDGGGGDGGGGEEGRGWQGLPQEAHAVQGAPSGGGGAVAHGSSSLITPVADEIDGEEATRKRRRRRRRRSDVEYPEGVAIAEGSEESEPVVLVYYTSTLESGHRGLSGIINY